MKTLPLALLTVAMLSVPCRAQAQTDSARELKRLQEERDKAVAVAMEPIKRRYLSSLEPLLRRATQANDLDTAIKIREEIQKSGAAGQGVAESGAAAAFAAKLIGTKWIYFGKETITFMEDGKAQWSSGRDPWPWKVTSGGRRVVEGENMAKKAKFTMTFSADLKTGTVEGDGNKREIRNITSE